MLIPNNVQKTRMFQHAGTSRFAYNWALAQEYMKQLRSFRQMNTHGY
ncbi:MAG: helix-turn-helix domain-containing protein [Lachnospiraceae bacterium]